MDKITLRSPATIANLSCGFDILGVCLNEPYDEITISKNASKEVIIHSLDSEFSNIPTIPEKNTGGVPAQLIMNDLNLGFGFDIFIKKGIPLCGGLGSSAATAAGVAYGINKLLNNKFSEDEVVRYALEGEKLTSDSPHADNIGPCITGGLLIIKSTNPLELIKVKTSNMYFSIIHPDVKVDTKTSRRILPEKVYLKDAIKQWGNVAALTYGFSSNNFDIIKSAMSDVIIEPIRSKLIPYFKDIKTASLQSGSIGCSISGSGPSIFSLSETQNDAAKVLGNMEKILIDNGIKFHSYISSINQEGITIV
jgi:homoserine kinase